MRKKGVKKIEAIKKEKTKIVNQSVASTVGKSQKKNQLQKIYSKYYV